MGDVLLLEGRDRAGWAIRLAQRAGGRGRASRFTHAALVLDAAGTIVEATIAGIRLGHLDDWRDRTYTWVRVPMRRVDRAEVAGFAYRAFTRGGRYDLLTIASVALALLTGGRLTVGVDGAEICSSLVARALERADWPMPREPGAMTPADLAIALGAA